MRRIIDPVGLGDVPTGTNNHISMKNLQELFSEKTAGLWRETSDLRAAPGMAAAEWRGGRAAPRPLAVSRQLVVRQQVIRGDTGRDRRPS